MFVFAGADGQDFKNPILSYAVGETVTYPGWESNRFEKRILRFLKGLCGLSSVAPLEGGVLCGEAEELFNLWIPIPSSEVPMRAFEGEIVGESRKARKLGVRNVHKAQSFRVVKEVPIRDVLHNIAKSRNIRTRCLVAEHPLTQQGVVSSLASDKVPSVRAAAVRSGKLSRKKLKYMISDEKEKKFVKFEIAREPNTPAGVLAAAAEVSVDCAMAVAMHPNAAADLLGKLASHASPSVRMRIIGNPHTAATTIERLANDENKYVKAAVEQFHSAQNKGET